MSEQGTTKDLSRPRCWLLGCYLGEHGHCCERCGVDVYENFIQYGKLDPLIRLYWRAYRAIRHLGPRKCDCCGKTFRSFRPERVCSDECYEQWLPF